LLSAPFCWFVQATMIEIPLKNKIPDIGVIKGVVFILRVTMQIYFQTSGNLSDQVFFTIVYEIKKVCRNCRPWYEFSK
jgi:hypothetical protein